MKDKSGERIMKEFVALRAITYRCFIHDGSEEKKARGSKIVSSK